MWGKWLYTKLTMQKRKFGPKIIWSYGDCKMGVKSIWVSDLEKSLGGMQRDIASTVHSTQQSTPLTAPTSYLPKRKRKAISFFSSFAALWLVSPHSPMGLPGIQGISWILHHRKALLILWLLLIQTLTHEHHYHATYIQPSSQMVLSQAVVWAPVTYSSGKSLRRPNAEGVHRSPLSHGLFQFPSYNQCWFCKLGHTWTCQAAYDRSTDPKPSSCASGCVMIKLQVVVESSSPSLLPPMSLWCF